MRIFGYWQPLPATYRQWNIHPLPYRGKTLFGQEIDTVSYAKVISWLVNVGFSRGKILTVGSKLNFYTNLSILILPIIFNQNYEI